MASSSSPTPDPPPPPPHRVRLPLRDLLILLVSIAVGVGAEQLLIHAGIAFGQAVVGGFAGFVGCFYFLDRITE